MNKCPKHLLSAASLSGPMASRQPESSDTQHTTAQDKQEYVVETQVYTKPLGGKGGQEIKKGEISKAIQKHEWRTHSENMKVFGISGA